MPTLTITVPSELVAYLGEQLAAGDHDSASAYITALVEADRKRRAEEKLVALVKEAEASGPAAPMTATEWERLRTKLTSSPQRTKRRNGKNPPKARRR